MIAVDCQGFSSIIGLGVIRAGFTIVAKYEANSGFGDEQRGYGIELVTSNRAAFGEFPIYLSDEPEWGRDGWPWKGQVDLLYSNPACSAFSSLTSANPRARENFGVNSPYLAGQRDTIKLASRVRPRVVVMESVQGAYHLGSDVMRDHWANLVAWSGLPYQLSHVLMSAADVGGYQNRRRYFWVAHLGPFGVLPATAVAPPLSDVIGDLAGLRLGRGGSPDGHFLSTRGMATKAGEIARFASAHGAPMIGGETIADLALRLPDVLEAPEFKYDDQLANQANVRRDKSKPVAVGDPLIMLTRNSAFTPRRMYPDRVSWTLIGGALETYIHPWLDRAITHREAARIMGIPDDIVIEPTIAVHGAQWLGKAVPVQSGQWIAESAAMSIRGELAGLTRGRTLETGDVVIDVEPLHRDMPSSRELVMTGRAPYLRDWRGRQTAEFRDKERRRQSARRRARIAATSTSPDVTGRDRIVEPIRAPRGETVPLQAIDVLAFAGGFDCGVQQAGFEVVAKREPAAFGGFGVPAVERNIPGIQVEVTEPEFWSMRRADMVFGNPRCSGFSVLSSVNKAGFGARTQDQRSVDSAMNEDMWQLIHYAAKVKPSVVVFESVQSGGKMGAGLMERLWETLREESRLPYQLTSVFMNAALVGGDVIRPRFFFVAHLKPFGVDLPHATPRTLREVIGDLPDREEPDDMDWGHFVQPGKTTARIGKTIEFLRQHDLDWTPGGRLPASFAQLTEKGIEIPDYWYVVKPDGERKILSHAIKDHLYVPVRARADQTFGVVVGDFMARAVHPWAPRTFTYREGARLMGLPDDWSLEPITSRNAGNWLGKGIPVASGRWIATWAKASIEDDPGEYAGIEVSDGHRVIDVTNEAKVREIEKGTEDGVWWDREDRPPRTFGVSRRRRPQSWSAGVSVAHVRPPRAPAAPAYTVARPTIIESMRQDPLGRSPEALESDSRRATPPSPVGTSRHGEGRGVPPPTVTSAGSSTVCQEHPGMPIHRAHGLRPLEVVRPIAQPVAVVTAAPTVCQVHPGMPIHPVHSRQSGATADAGDSNSSARESFRVRVPGLAPTPAPVKVAPVKVVNMNIARVHPDRFKTLMSELDLRPLDVAEILGVSRSRVNELTGHSRPGSWLNEARWPAVESALRAGRVAVATA